MHIFEQQAQAQAQAQHMSFIDFCSLFDRDSFDEEVLMHGNFIGMVRSATSGMLEVHAMFVFDDAAQTGNDDAMGRGWYL